jgi:chorismate-pyruvate lyase
MTVTLERFHESPVALEVLRSERRDACYVRKIVLRRARDQQVVLFGVVRLNLRLLPPPVVEEIKNESTPLGHVLIRHQVLREVERLAAWHVRPGPELKALFGPGCSDPLYGRTAIIHCNGEPAIELLEIVVADNTVA